MRDPRMTPYPSLVRRFLDSTSGALATWAAAAMPVVIGGAAFSVDAARIYNLDADLQGAADAMARAAAVELDRRDDALTRATDVVNRFVKNQTQMGESPGTVTAESVLFLKSLPTQSHVAPSASDYTTDPREAKYVEVKVVPRNIQTMFPRSMLSKTLNLKLSADAVAGQSHQICGVAPIFLCNPFEDTGEDLMSALDDPDFQRRQIQFKRPTGQTSKRGGKKGKGNNCGGDKSTWGPGSFGYLEIPGYQGASAMREAVGIDIPDICFSTGDTVRLKTGNINSMHFGFNVRFDMYDGPMKDLASDIRYAPAENVVRGMSGTDQNCRDLNGRRDTAMGLPRDNCQDNGNCSMGHGQVGDGDWDFISYMKVNHNYMSPITIAGTTYTIDYRRHRMTPSTKPSRYQMYRWEIDNNCIPGPNTYGQSSQTDEEGTPTCHTNGPSTSVDDRRVITAAVLNCEAIDATIGMKHGRDLPVETFVKVFLTEPVGSGSESTIYGEVIGPIRDETDSLSNQRAQLSR